MAICWSILWENNWQKLIETDQFPRANLENIFMFWRLLKERTEKKHMDSCWVYGAHPCGSLQLEWWRQMRRVLGRAMWHIISILYIIYTYYIYMYVYIGIYIIHYQVRMVDRCSRFLYFFSKPRKLFAAPVTGPWSHGTSVVAHQTLGILGHTERQLYIGARHIQICDMCIYTYINVFVYIHIYIYIMYNIKNVIKCLNICLSNLWSSLSVCLCLSVCLAVYLSIYLSVCLSIYYLSIHLI